MKKYLLPIILAATLLLPLYGESATITFVRDVYYNKAATGGSGGVAIATGAGTTAVYDDFGVLTQQDFATGGDGAKSYGWSVVNSVNATLIDANTTNAGVLSIRGNTTDSGIGGDYFTAPCVFQAITGDFDIETSITGFPATQYQGAGIIVAHETDWLLHAYMLNYKTGTSTKIKALSGDGATDNAIGTEYGFAMQYLRVTRVDNTITFYRKANAGNSWTTHGSVERSDFGSTVRVGLFMQTGNTLGTYTAKFDYIRGSGIHVFSPLEKRDTSESPATKFAIRASAADSGDVTVSLDNNYYVLALDNNGIPGTWGSYGDNIVITNLGTTNKAFWVKAKALSDTAIGASLANSIRFTGTGVTTAHAAFHRYVFPPLSVLGTDNSLYLGYDWGGSSYWGHNGSSAGDIDVYVAGGSSYTNVVYDNSSTVGDVTTLNKNIADNLSLTTTATRKANGTYLIKHTLTSTVDMWIKLVKKITGASTNHTSTVSVYHTAATANADAEAFQAVALHRTNDMAVGLIAGDGYSNDWCIYRYDYTDNTAWFNTEIMSKTDNTIQLTYGKLKNASTTDYTVQLEANTARDVSYVLTADLPLGLNQADTNAILYGAYNDAFNGDTTRNPVEKVFWSTSHQLRRIKRHILVEGSKVFWINVSPSYAPIFDAGDAVMNIIGQSDSAIVTPFLNALHSLGSPDGAAITSSLQASAANAMDNTYALYVPYFELYAKTFYNYTPDNAALTKYLAIADAYADVIGNKKLIPDTTTQDAHLATDIYAGTEPIGYGDFEQAFMFVQSCDNVYRWATEVSGTGTVSRVGVDGGVTPHGGSYQAKLYSNSALDYGRLVLMKIGVPAGKSIVPTAWVNIPSPFSSGGYRFVVKEYNSGDNLIVTNTDSDTTTTSGWQQITGASVTLNASTVYIRITVEAHGVGTAYVDDVQCTITDPDYTGLIWTVNIMPPQIKGDAINPNLWGMVWTQLNLRSLKELLGGSWTATHQSVLDNVNAAYPAAFWTDNTSIKVKDSLYHHKRSNWLNSWTLFGHFMWYILTGEKIFTDNQVGNIYANYPSDNLAKTYGNVAFKGWVVQSDNTAIPSDDVTALFLSCAQNAEGEYVNAASWFWAGDVFFHMSAYWAGVSGALTSLLSRELIEVTKYTYSSHEVINIAGWEGATYYGYGANVIALNSTPIILSLSSMTPSGGTLSWTVYPQVDFTNYKVCRSESSPVGLADAIDTIETQGTITYTDTSASPDTLYYYTIFATKDDGTTVGSNEAEGTTTGEAALRRKRILFIQ